MSEKKFLWAQNQQHSHYVNELTSQRVQQHRHRQRIPPHKAQYYLLAVIVHRLSRRQILNLSFLLLTYGKLFACARFIRNSMVQV